MITRLDSQNYDSKCMLISSKLNVLAGRCTGKKKKKKNRNNRKHPASGSCLNIWTDFLLTQSSLLKGTIRLTCTVRTVYHPVHMITGCDNLWSRLLMFPFSVWPRYPLSCLVNDDLNWITDWLYLFLGFSSTNKPRDDVFKTSLWNCNAQTSRTSCFLRSTTVVFGRDSAGRASIVTLSSCPAFFFFPSFLTRVGKALLSSYHFKQTHLSPLCL